MVGLPTLGCCWRQGCGLLVSPVCCPLPESTRTFLGDFPRSVLPSDFPARPVQRLELALQIHPCLEPLGARPMAID